MNNTLRSYCKISHIRRLLKSQNPLVTIRYVTTKQLSCNAISGTNHINDKLQIRVHSTQSDQRRQKVLMPTSTKIDIEKIGEISKEDGKRKLNELWMSVEPYVKLARWDRPIGVYLLFWPCSWSISLACIEQGVPITDALQMLGLFALGAGLMRGAGCTINDMWDKDVDAQVERTRSRPLVSGAITTPQAWAFLAAQLSLALGVLLQLNCYTVVLGASSMALVITYPLAKRFTNYPQLFLGATFNWGALVGYSAVCGHVSAAVCLPLYAAAIAWTTVYDTVYAHQDKVDDLRIGMKSTALTFGASTKPILTACLASCGACAALAGLGGGMQWPYYAALMVAGGSVGTQIYRLDVDNPAQCDAAFQSNAYIGLLILIAILAGGYNKYMENRSKFNAKEYAQTTKPCFFR